MLDGFRSFIARGNVIDLAVGVIIGGLFTKIVTALVDGIISPLIAAIFGKPNFDNVGVFTLNGATISFGMVLTALVNFLLTAAAVYYLIVVPINKVKGPKPEPAKPEDVVLLGEIRDLLKAK